MAIEKEFTLESVERILKRTGVIRDILIIKKHFLNPKFSVSVESLCSYIGIDLDRCANLTSHIRHKKIKAISAVQPTFQKGCICVQMYDDTEEDMRWAVRNGALAVVVKELIEGLPCIVSECPEIVYAKMCQYYRNLSDAKAIAITGSIGKTTTKLMIDAVLKQQYNTICNPTNENALYQVGYCAQHIPKDAKILIQEISEDTPGYTKPMSMIIKPNIVVITTIDKSHMEAYGSEDNIVKEVCSITAGMSTDGTVIVNKDSFKCFDYLNNKNVITVSVKDISADFSAKNINVNHDGILFDIYVKDNGNFYPIHLKNIYAIHNVITALFAFAVGTKCNESPENIIHGLQSFKMSGIRQNILKVNDITIYADCYNAIAKSVESAINACEIIPIKGKRIAVLGDVEECGNESDEQHNAIISTMYNSSFSVIIAIGEKIKKAIDRNPIITRCEVIHCKNHESIVEALKENCKKGDLVLFKASHASRLDLCIGKMWPSLRTEILKSESGEEYSKWWKRIKMN